ncbi:rhodanese-like domain-containing protein [Hymenobacter psychrophilus]|uniref:Rhodanese-like domain-containing protein n=1 Tax=Hymenobacter psychrophilus TaxID=651662 RepID=A0A1H3NHG4_9BACT|nr:rhodanese-like domain-containing protein [Hymenobacter psychrophilus]SDY88347.1 Rhodanese-like domain-containing protein [Hymenobacter psychrophilus]
MKRATFLVTHLLRGRWLLALGLLFLVAGTSACGQQRATPERSMTAYDRMLGLLYKGTVSTIQPTELATLLHEAPATGGGSVLLLDTRTPAEYKVSHLRGARFVDFENFRRLELKDVARTRPVVVYCTVGARSEQVGSWLREQGFRDVRNLYGGIFQWMNDGQTVVNAQGPTTDVHPYSVLWRPWLKTGNPVYEAK